MKSLSKNRALSFVMADPGKISARRAITTKRSKRFCKIAMIEIVRVGIVALAAIIVIVSVTMIAAATDTVQLERQHGTYMVPVRINNAVSLPFILDSGAAEVANPTDVFLTLLRTGTVMDSDFIGTGTYVLADGSEQSSDRFVLHELRVGDHVVRNVIANVVSVKGDPLLGQSFLSKLPAWAIDNARHALVLYDTSRPLGEQQQTALGIPTSPPQPQPPTPMPMTVPEIGLAVSQLEERAQQALVAKNYADAMRWCRLAADQDSAWCENEIGRMYEHGWGVAQDQVEAMRWYRMAAAQDLPEAQYNIGAFYLNGSGIPQDYVEAMRWFRMAAEQGEAHALTGVGMMYHYGQGGVSQDYTEAIRWYQMAADKGEPVAQTNMGVLYLDGAGVPQNYTEAMRWFQIAAAKGHPMAQNNIGWLAAQGLGVSKDCDVAKGWFETAGDEHARNNLRSGAGGACRW
jgi:TPR repeat protein